MAQYFVDKDNFLLSDFGDAGSTADSFGLDVDPLTSETVIKLVVGSAGATVSKYYIPAGQAVDLDIVTVSRSPDTGSQNKIGIQGRISDSVNNDFYKSFVFQSNKIYIGKEVSGSRSYLANVTSESITSYAYHRFSITGANPTTLKARRWTGTANDEPATWELETTDASASLQDSGFAGLGAYIASTNYYKFLGIGTDGDPAPTEPVGGGTTDDLTANDISSTSQVSSPAISQTHSLTASDVSSLSSVTAPALGQTHNLTATDVQSTSEVSNPALATQSNTDNLSANDISSTSTVSSPALGQIHNLAANDATSTSETGTPTLRQTHALTSVDIQSLSTVSSPALTSVAGQDSLAANDVQATSTVSSPTIGQVHNLTADNLSSQSETDSPTLGQVHALTANDLNSATQVSSPTLRDASQVLVTPIKNTRATVSQVQYGATVSQTTYKAAIIQPVYKAEAG